MGQKLLNVTETKCMVFHSYGKKSYSHIDHISIKISRVVGIMYRMKVIYPQEILQMNYSTLTIVY